MVVPLVRPDSAAHERLQRQLVAWGWFFRYHIGLSVVLTVWGVVVGSWLLIGFAAFMCGVSVLWLAWFWRYRRHVAALRREREDLFWESIQHHLNSEAGRQTATRAQGAQERH